MGVVSGGLLEVPHVQFADVVVGGGVVTGRTPSLRQSGEGEGYNNVTGVALLGYVPRSPCSPSLVFVLWSRNFVQL